MKAETELKINEKCKGAFCEWRLCLQQIEQNGDILRRPVSCDGCSMWIE